MSRRNASRNSNSKGKPAWVWFVLGNFVGGFVVFIVFLQGLKQDSDSAAAAGAQPPAEHAGETAAKAPRFDFYTLLKENEVSVPPPKTPQPARRGDTESRASESGHAPAVEPDLVYILQAASFRDAAEAERLRARLSLANLAVKVETASDSRGTWHRVLIGPYISRSRMTKAREVLAEHELTPLVLKRPAR